MNQALRIFALFTALFWGFNSQSLAQIVGPVPSPYESIKQNSVSVMEAIGDTLWIGPGLNRTIANQRKWFYPQNVSEISGGSGRLFSLALAPDTVIAGLGYNAESAGGNVQSGLGFLISVDGGDSWRFVENPNEAENDTSFVYGNVTYSKLPVTAQEQSPPFEVAQHANNIFSANWALGLVRSIDFGQSWKRLILPPQQADSLVPEHEYEFNAGGNNRYDPRFDQNLLGFSVLVDRQGRVWCGTAGGVNISYNALTAPADSIRWRHIQFDDSKNGLLGNWIITIRQHPASGDIWMTNWAAGLSESEKFGVVRTADGSQSFDHYLVGQRINDIGFNGDAIYAAGDNGLFESRDNGNSWQQIQQIRSANTFIKSSAQYYSMASTTDRLWVSTSDGLASTDDGGQSWQITRVDFPLDGRNRYKKDSPSVESYAYPNPFSPRRHELVRIKYEVKQSGTVTVRLFDFGMNLIRELDSDSYTAGTFEAVWDGTDRQGRQVANGPVFYQIDTPGNTIRGKILVID